MNRTPMHKLLDRGRKAGLRTADLYQALSSRQPDATDEAPGHTDCNGYVPQVDANGHRTYVPQPAPRA